MELRLYNTLTRNKEIFRPIEPGKVRLYTCGPTVYRFIHIGNLRSFMLADWIRRTLLHFGYEVRHVKNITDVGHMRQELLDRGEDKMIAAARKEGKIAVSRTFRAGARRLARNLKAESIKTGELKKKRAKKEEG